MSERAVVVVVGVVVSRVSREEDRWGAAFKELKDGIKQFSQDALKEVSTVVCVCVCVCVCVFVFFPLVNGYKKIK